MLDTRRFLSGLLTTVMALFKGVCSVRGDTLSIKGERLYIVITTLIIIFLSSPTLAVDYTVKQISNNEAHVIDQPLTNKSGQVVWGYDNGTGIAQLFYYSNGVTKQITNSTYYNTNWQINDHGQIVWVAWDGNRKIFLYSNGLTTQISDDGYWGTDPQINNSGQIVWQGGSGSNYSNTGIFLYSNGVTTQISESTNSYSVSPQINNSGKIV